MHKLKARGRVVVVGAGVFGAAAAWELAKRHFEVCVIDPGPLPHVDAASTDISKVVRADYGADELYSRLMQRCLDGWRSWNERQSEPLFHETGFAILSSVPLSAGSFEADSFATLGGLGFELERLDGSDIAARFPAWSTGRYIDGYFNPAGGWAESGRVVGWLIEQALASGAELRDGAVLDGLVEDGARVTGVRLGDGELIEADAVVVAAGAWTSQLVPELGDRLEPIGQPVMHFRPPDPGRFRPPAFVPWAADIGRTGWYGFPANADDVVKIANHGPGVRTDPRGARQLPDGSEARFREQWRRSVPALAAAPVVKTRLCLYCDSFDGDLWIAEHPHRPGLVVAAGGSGHGFKFAPALGRWIADAVEGRSDPSLARFAWRERGTTRSEHARFDG
jgi:glycine/D-amino acid oxidase-like deaminating enzyme